MVRRLACRTLFLLLVCFALLSGSAQSAFAHAAFLDSSPAPGTRLEGSPAQVTLKFTEPLIRALSKATLVNAATGRRGEARIEVNSARREIVLRPAAALGRAAYRVEWRTVSPVDGHALEGSLSFGVRTAAVGGEHQIEQSPLARGGWLRIVLRALFYASLFFFAGGLINATLLARREPADWLFPRELDAALKRVDGGSETFASRAWLRTLDAGWLAAGTAAAIAVVEAADAGGGLTLQGLNDFLLTNAAGLARVGTVIALAMAALLARSVLLAAAAWSALAFLTIAVGGHANSAEPRLVAVATDWTHLLAAAVWIGGIAQIAFAWLPALRGAGRDLRSAIMRAVLDRFGTVALPAFLVVAATGLLNGLIELGHPEALWQTSYGRVLAVKIALVGLIAFASYWHALRLRPRLLSTNPHPAERLERRHWRLLSVEPPLAIAVVTAAAALVAFPLPPRQFGEVSEARATPVCDPCPLPKPQAADLAVAEQAGSRIAAFWLRREGQRVSGTLRLLDTNERPLDAPVRLAGSELESCGPGCRRFNIAEAGDLVTVAVEEKGREYRASVPARWRQSGNAEARRLVERAQGAMRGLRSVQEEERLTSGPGSYVRTLYRLRAPHRFAYRTSSGARSIVIGKRQWDRVGSQPWQAEEFGGFTAFRTRDFFRWTPYARATRLLDIRRSAGQRIAVVALTDPATPLWFRLKIDLATMRVLGDRMITGAHFMSRRYFAPNKPVEIRPPARSVPAR